MAVSAAAVKRLAAIQDVTVVPDAPLSSYTRFQIGGPASLLCDASNSDAFIELLHEARALQLPYVVIGGGTNLVVSDRGCDGLVLRHTGTQITQNGTLWRIEAGALLQDVVDQSIARGFKGLETMTGIPGYLGGAIYGNAGAYGHAIQEIVERVELLDGERVSTLTNEQCRFRYRESAFKERKEWVILSADLCFQHADARELTKTATGIRTIRDAKYPPTMKCAGSIFKNVFFADLPASVQSQVPESVIREGKVPSAWFLEQTGAKGMRRGDIQVASYHANLVYNDGSGTSHDLVAVIQDLKRRVLERFGFELEEEVQFVGFEDDHARV